MSWLNYAIPILLLVLIIVAFFLLGRGSFRSFGVAQILIRVVVALPLLGSGIFLHFFRVHTTASIIPPGFPAPVFLVLLTGVFEIAGAVGLFIASFRRAAAFWIAVMMVAIIPANVFVAGKVVDGIAMPGIAVRTAMQIVYVVLVLLAGYGVPRRSQVANDVAAKSVGEDV
ncbi:MAG: DoxX family membrane protein [Terracidiphilus sp.]